MWVTIGLKAVRARVVGRKHQFRMSTCRMPFGVGNFYFWNVDIEPAGCSEAVS